MPEWMLFVITIISWIVMTVSAYCAGRVHGKEQANRKANEYFYPQIAELERQLAERTIEQE